MEKVPVTLQCRTFGHLPGTRYELDLLCDPMFHVDRLCYRTAIQPTCHLLERRKVHNSFNRAVDFRDLQSISQRMHPFSSLTIGIFVAGYITARWDLVTRLYELALFAWDHGVVVGKLMQSSKCLRQRSDRKPQTRATKAFALLSLFFLVLVIPLERIAAHEAMVHPRSSTHGISAKEQLRRRGSF